MKRFVSLVLCMALAFGAVTYRPPQAKALALETYGIVSLVGLFLTSMGLTWAYDNYQSAVADAPVTKFGSNLAEDLQGWLDETQSGKVIDVFFGDKMPNLSPTPGSNGGIAVIAGAAFTAAVASFGKWLYDKYALSENDTAVVMSDYTVTLIDGSVVSVTLFDSSYSYNGTWVNSVPFVGDSVFSYGDISRDITIDSSLKSILTESSSRLYLTKTTYKEFKETLSSSWGTDLTNVYLAYYDGSILVALYGSDMGWATSTGLKIASSVSLDGSSLSVSAPNGLNLPDTDSLPEGQGYVLELPETNGAPIQDLNDLMDLVVPMALNNPEYVPTLNPAEIINPDPIPTPDGEEVPEPAPAGATIIDYLVDIWRKIKALPETIGNAVKSAFEPDPELVTEITTTFTDKFSWLETVHRFGQDLFGMTADTAPPLIYIHLEDAEGQYTYGGTEKALDLSWYQRYKADVDRILSGFMWLAFLWLVFKRASAIIQGGEMITEYTNDLDQGHR